MKKILIIFAGFVAVLSVVVVFRAARFPSRQTRVAPAHEIELRSAPMIERLSKAIQYKTISSPQENERIAEFDRFHAFLAASFPAVHGALTKEAIAHHSLLYTWQGQDPRLKPILLMGHMDVVPAEPASERHWTHPPFSGRVAGGFVWGRGTMDDKAGVLGMLEAAEHLLSRRFRPQRTIYLAFGHDEEIGGYDGAAQIAEVLRTRGVELEFALDEGGNITAGILSDITAPVALIGTAEKGYVSLELTVAAAGGHSSTPPPRTAIGLLSAAIDRIERSPLPSRLSGPTREMFEFVAPEMAWSNRIVLGNLWLFEPWVRSRLARSPLTNAAIRTTYAFTVSEAGAKENLLPTKARAIMNARILPGDSIAAVIEHVRGAAGDARVEIMPLPIRAEPSPVSRTDSPPFNLLQRTINEIAPEVVVAPSLLVAATDSRHYAGLTKNIFRFLPITLTPEDASRYHGVNERILIEDYERCVRFYVQLMRNAQAQ